MGKTAYPEILTAAKWDKEKGILAKVLKGETGMGAILNELKKVYEAVPWGTLDEGLLAGVKSNEDADQVFAAGRATLNGPIDVARKKAIEVGKHATKVAGDLKKVKLAPKSTRELAEKISSAAVDFSVALRDEAIETLKKFEARAKDFAEGGDEVKKIGEAYIANRKLAVTQMTQLKSLHIEAKTRITMMAGNADKLAKAAVATPTTAAQAVTDITAMNAEAGTVLQNAIDRYRKDGDVNTNPVQAKARGNIGGITGKPQFDEALKAFQTKSGGDFNTIMAMVAEILKTQSELKTMVAGMETSLDIAKDAATAGTKTLGDHQNSARAAVNTAMGLATKMKDELEKIAKRVVALKEPLANAKKDPKQIPGVRNVFETSVTENERRVATMQQYALQVEGLKKRIAALPQTLQSDGIVKGETAKLDGILKNFQAAIKQAQDGYAQILKMREQLPQA